MTYQAFSQSTSMTRRVFQFPDNRVSICITEKDWPWGKPVMAKLDQLVKLEYGWDGYRGSPVSFDNATFALRMLEVIYIAEAPEPQIVPGPGGDLQIEWHTPDADIELHVKAPNNVLAWRATSRTGPEGEEVNLTNDFIEVVQWIKELVEPVNAIVAATA